MKKLLVIISLMFVVLCINAQTIKTTLVHYIDNEQISSSYKADNIFICNSSTIEWIYDENIVLYYIESVEKNKDKYTIKCNTFGKNITFIVDFKNQLVYSDVGLLFEGKKKF